MRGVLSDLFCSYVFCSYVFCLEGQCQYVKEVGGRDLRWLK